MKMDKIENLANLQTLLGNVVAAFEQNKEVTLKPSDVATRAFKAGLDLTTSEIGRIKKNRENGGRKQKAVADLKNPDKALQMRRLRKKWGGSRKPTEGASK